MSHRSPFYTPTKPNFMRTHDRSLRKNERDFDNAIAHNGDLHANANELSALLSAHSAHMRALVVECKVDSLVREASKTSPCTPEDRERILDQVIQEEKLKQADSYALSASKRARKTAESVADIVTQHDIILSAANAATAAADAAEKAAEEEREAKREAKRVHSQGQAQAQGQSSQDIFTPTSPQEPSPSAKRAVMFADLAHSAADALDQVVADVDLDNDAGIQAFKEEEEREALGGSREDE